MFVRLRSGWTTLICWDILGFHWTTILQTSIDKKYQSSQMMSWSKTLNINTSRAASELKTESNFQCVHKHPNQKPSLNRRRIFLWFGSDSEHTVVLDSWSRRDPRTQHVSDKDIKRFNPAVSLMWRLDSTCSLSWDGAL